MQTKGAQEQQCTQRGQTLVEVIIAVGILLAGIVGLITLSFASLSADQISSRKIVAMNLAREGIEVLRNVRDSNWLAGRTDDCSQTPTDYTDDVWYGVTPIGNECVATEIPVITAFEPRTQVWTTMWALAPRRALYFTSENIYLQPNPFDGSPASIYRRHLRLVPHDNTQPGNTCAIASGGKCARITYYQIFAEVEYKLGSKTHSVEIVTELHNWKP